jgi:hypothetical protein
MKSRRCMCPPCKDHANGRQVSTLRRLCAALLATLLLQAAFRGHRSGKRARQTWGAELGQTRPVPPVLPTPRLPLCPVSGQTRAALQYVAMGQFRK